MKYPLRFLALSLAITLVLPHSALALRQTGLEESHNVKQKLVAELTAGLEEIRIRWAFSAKKSPIRPQIEKILKENSSRNRSYFVRASDTPFLEVQDGEVVLSLPMNISDEDALRQQLESMLAWMERDSLADPVRLVLAPHEDLEHGQWTAARLESQLSDLNAGDRPVVIWFEHAGEFPRTVRAFLEELTKAGIALPPNLNLQTELLKDSLDPDVVGFLKRLYEQAQRETDRSPPTFQDYGEGDSVFGSKMDAVRRLLAGGWNIALKLERAPFESWLKMIRSDALTVASRGAMLKGQAESAVRMTEKENELVREAVALRDRALAEQIEKFHRANPWAVHLVARGKGHRKTIVKELADRRLNSRSTVFESSDRPALIKVIEAEDPLSLEMARRFAVESHLEHVLKVYLVLLGSRLEAFHQEVPWGPEAHLSILEAIPEGLIDAWFREVASQPRDSQDPLMKLLEASGRWLLQQKDQMPEPVRGLLGQIQDADEKTQRWIWTETGPTAGSAGKSAAQGMLEQILRGIGEKTMKSLVADPARVIDLAVEMPVLKEMLEGADYSGIARLVPVALLPQASLISTITVLVQGSQKETIEQGLAGKVAFTDRVEEANLVIGDVGFDPELKSQYLASRQGPFLEVNKADVAERISVEFLTNLQTDGLFVPGSILFLDRLVSGDLGEAILVFA